MQFSTFAKGAARSSATTWRTALSSRTLLLMTPLSLVTPHCSTYSTTAANGGGVQCGAAMKSVGTLSCSN
eukprot:2815972-Pyramimonas_sp.AAC.1